LILLGAALLLVILLAVVIRSLQTEAIHDFNQSVRLGELPPGHIVYSTSLLDIQGHDFTVLRTLPSSTLPKISNILTDCTSATSCISPWQPINLMQGSGIFLGSFGMVNYGQPWRSMIEAVMKDPSTVCTGYGATDQLYPTIGVVLLCLSPNQHFVLYHSQRD